ncbi:uncharacterized protein [Notamacropus eugenii]|uniref:uncharacterized protein isoform X1 n=1 Tax=Notamacropus eugenii TaxID=9315 RepID=UPI003B66F2CD
MVGGGPGGRVRGAAASSRGLSGPSLRGSGSPTVPPPPTLPSPRTRPDPAQGMPRASEPRLEKESASRRAPPHEAPPGPRRAPHPCLGGRNGRGGNGAGAGARALPPPRPRGRGAPREESALRRERAPGPKPLVPEPRGARPGGCLPRSCAPPRPGPPRLVPQNLRLVVGSGESGFLPSGDFRMCAPARPYQLYNTESARAAHATAETPPPKKKSYYSPSSPPPPQGIGLLLYKTRKENDLSWRALPFKDQQKAMARGLSWLRSVQRCRRGTFHCRVQHTIRQSTSLC